MEPAEVQGRAGGYERERRTRLVGDTPPGSVLVTGGAGYLGSALVGELLEAGYRVRALDLLVHGSPNSLLHVWGSRRFDFVRADIRDDEAVRRALEGMTAVVHLAAIVGDPACARDPELAREVNYDATGRLLALADGANVQKFVFASTCSNYGKADDDGKALVTEDWPLKPISIYAETKVEAEKAVLRHARDGFCTTCLRFATVYGVSPRMRFDLTVNEFARDVALGRELVVYGEQFWRPYIHVRDAARAVQVALQTVDDELCGEVFNVGSTQENYRKLDLVELLTARFPDAVIRFVQRDEDPRDYRVSFEKIRSQLAFRPEASVNDGIDEIVALLRSGVLADPDAAVYRN